MPTRGRPAKLVEISSEEKDLLEKLILDSGAGRIGKRARAVLLASTGASNDAIAKQLGWSHASVCNWKKRYLAKGIQGLQDEPRSGRKSSPIELSDEDRQTLIT